MSLALSLRGQPAIVHGLLLGRETCKESANSMSLAFDDIAQCLPRIVPVDSFAPQAIESLRTIHAVVTFEDGAYVAAFVDANINGSGDSPLEAVEMLKEMIASAFLFYEQNEAQLGSEPQRQLAVLREFIKRR